MYNIEDIETYNISFERSVVENDMIMDSYSGNLFSNNEFVFVDISSPIKQNFIIRDNNTILFYPEENKAITLKSNTISILPFFYTLKAFSVEDFGLSEKGYILDSTHFFSDEKTITSYWTPPKELQENIYKLELLIEQNNIVDVKYLNKDGVLVSSIQFLKIKEYNKILLPSEIIFTGKNSIGGLITETIIFNKIIINAPLPKEVIEFKLPDNIEIEEVEW